MYLSEGDCSFKRLIRFPLVQTYAAFALAYVVIEHMWQMGLCGIKPRSYLCFFGDIPASVESDQINHVRSIVLHFGKYVSLFLQKDFFFPRKTSLA